MEKGWIKRKSSMVLFVLSVSVCILAGCNGNAATSEQHGSGSEVSTGISSEMPSESETLTAEDNSAGTGDSTGLLHEDEPITESREAEGVLALYINDEKLSVAWEDNEAVGELMKLASKEALTIEMSMYGGFEQVGALGWNLPRDDKQVTTNAGDIVLYSGNQIVVFYGSNSWSYTKLGHIENKTAEELKQMLGQAPVTIAISNCE